MSIVGPRPLAVIYLDYYNDEEKKRHTVLPGLTGLAQVNGRNVLNWNERYELGLRCCFEELKLYCITAH